MSDHPDSNHSGSNHSGSGGGGDDRGRRLAPHGGALTPAQLRTFDELLAVGGPRPTTPDGLVEELAAHIEAGTADAVGAWTENRLWVGKSQIETVLRCEGQTAADKAAQDSNEARRVHPAVALGSVTHRAIQIAHTHPNQHVTEYVDAAIRACLRDEAFADFWTGADIAEQSDLIVGSVSRVTSWIDSWPELAATWTPRFEEPIQARVGKLVLSGRADLVLGRPRSDGRQTMFLCDFKSSGLSDHHLDEARFYALISTLRHGCAPFRSVVYSLASGDWTEPDVTAEALWSAADRVVRGTNAVVEILTDRRDATLETGRHCSWCTGRGACAAYRAWTDGSASTALADTVAGSVRRPPAATAAHEAASRTRTRSEHRRELVGAGVVAGATSSGPDPYALD